MPFLPQLPFYGSQTEDASENIENGNESEVSSLSGLVLHFRCRIHYARGLAKVCVMVWHPCEVENET